MLCAALYPNVVQVRITKTPVPPPTPNSSSVPLLNPHDLRLSLSLSVYQVRSPQGKYKQTSKGAVMLQPKADELRFMTKSDGCVNVHPSSVNYPVRMTHTDMHFRFGSVFQFQHIQRFLSIYYVFKYIKYILLYFSHGRCDTTTAPTWCTTRR